MALSFENVTPILPVRDLTVSSDYYVRVLGFHIDFHQPGIISSVSRDRCTIFLVEGDQGNPPTYLWVGVSDVDALLEEIMPRGAIVLHPPTNYPWDAYEIQIGDPDGNVLRFGSDRKPGVPDGEWRDMNGDLWSPVDGGWRLASSPGDAHERALIRRRSELAAALRNLGELERRSEKTVTNAQQHYQQAIRVYRELDQPLRLAHTLRHLGDIHREANRAELAGPLYEEALSLYRQHGKFEPLNVANALRSFAILQYDSGDRDSAEESWREARELYESVNVMAGVAGSSAWLALIAHDRGELDESRELLKRAQQIAAATEDEELIASVQKIASKIAGQAPLR